MIYRRHAIGHPVPAELQAMELRRGDFQGCIHEVRLLEQGQYDRPWEYNPFEEQSSKDLLHPDSVCKIAKPLHLLYIDWHLLQQVSKAPQQ